MPPFMSIEEELAEEERVLACQDAAKLQDDTKGALTLAISSVNNDILKGFELVVKLPKQPVVKAAIHSQTPVTNIVPSSLTVPSTITTTGSGSAAGLLAGSSRTSTDIAETSEEAKDASALAQQKDSQDSQPQAVSPNESSSNATGAIVAPIGSQVNPHQLMHRPPGHLTQPYLLEQLKDVQNHTSQALLRLDDYWKTGVVGSNQPLPKDIKESTRPLKTLLELLQRHLRAGIEVMAQPNKEKLYPFRVCDPKALFTHQLYSSQIFSPALSEDFVIEFYIRDSQLVCAAYALQLTGGSSAGSNGGYSGPSLSTFLNQAPLQTPPAPKSTESATGPLFSAATSHNRNSSTDANPSTGPHRRQRMAKHPLRHHSQLQPRQRETIINQRRKEGKSHLVLLRLWHCILTINTNHHSQSNPNLILGRLRVRLQLCNNRESTIPPMLLLSRLCFLHPAKLGKLAKEGSSKVATTLEEKMVQVQSSKLSEISAKLSAAEGLCRRLLHFLVLQESVVSSNGI
ncbi:hypothetical protein BGZ82_006579 [Podila clonocystis]|nr:hypothetical protein BGZ82_006579 [Podila clonocystis]